MKNLLLITAATAGLVGVASATVIFDATPSNTNEVFNTVGSGAGTPATGTVTGSAGALVITNSGVNFGMYGIASMSSINTLLGDASMAALTSADTVTFTATITGITGDIRANGIEFGMSPTATGFRPDDHLLYGLKAQNNDNTIVDNAFVDGGSSAGASATEGSIKDGFNITLTANNAGYTFFLSGIDAGGGVTTITKSGGFTGTQFVDNFANGHYYLAIQRFNTAPDTVMNISEASIAVVPEPSSLTLLGFGLTALLVRRRRGC
ncbi:MAG: PEP-CTERM sorting domain-containing protein [Luteolibacter sp.]